MDYIITGNTMINDLHFADNRQVKKVLGGAVYCVSGLIPWTNDILYVSGVGSDFKSWYGEYFDTNKLSYKGLKYCITKTNYNIVEYKPDGQWHEYSIYSKTYFEDHMKDIAINVNDFIDEVTNKTKGLYTESEIVDSFWNGVDLLKAQHIRLKIMWEIPTEDAFIKERREQVINNIKQCDMFSINLPEAKSLFCAKSEEECIKVLTSFHKPVFFRVGVKGAYLLMNGKTLFLGSVGASKAIDPTGCGNISTATAMYGICEGFSMERILAMANITAYYNTKQYGPKKSYSESEIKDINELVNHYSTKCEYK